MSAEIMMLGGAGVDKIIGSCETDTAENARANDATLSFPAIPGTQSGDLMHFCIGSDNNCENVGTIIGQIPGLTNVTFRRQNVSGSAKIYYYEAELTGPFNGGQSSPFTGSNFLGSGWAAVAWATRDLSYEVASSAKGTSGAPSPSATTNSAGAMLFALGCLDDDTVTSVTPPAGFTHLEWDHGVYNTARCTVMVAYLEDAPASKAVGPFSAGGQSDEWSALAVSLI